MAVLQPTRPARPRRQWAGYLLIAPAALWLGFFFLVPFYSLLANSLFNPSGSVLTGYKVSYDFANFWHAIDEYKGPMIRSFWYAALASAFCLILGYVLAYAIAFKVGRLKNLVLVLVVAPFFTSFLIRTLAWKLILGDNGWLVHTLRTVHILGSQGRLLATPFAVVAGLTYNFLPFTVLPLYTSLEKIDRRLIEAASDLYANPLKSFYQVTWKLSLPGVVGGTLMTFIPAVGDYINATLLGTPNQRMVGSVIEDLFTTSGDYALAGALSVILMLVILALTLSYVRRAGTEDLL